MLQLTQNIKSLFEKEECTLGLFIAPFKAYHIVDAEILTKLLQYYRIDDIALPWFKSYFRNRKIVLTFKEESKNSLDTFCGFP